MIPGFSSRRRFSDLTEQEILALAISSEEDDAQIYRMYAERLRADFPASAAIFDGMAAEEDDHRRRLIDEHERRFGGRSATFCCISSIVIFLFEDFSKSCKTTCAVSIVISSGLAILGVKPAEKM